MVQYSIFINLLTNTYYGLINKYIEAIIILIYNFQIIFNISIYNFQKLNLNLNLEINLNKPKYDKTKINKQVKIRKYVKVHNGRILN